ncbi:MAG TPA: VOC family protein [Thermoleophilaceae bacterium]|nr:VOC family protein [Thermoleophilaceae bacterium]
MGERTSHSPGTFSWTDLATDDTEGAKRFYTGLFGWEIDDRPIPGDGVYTMLLRDGKEVAALFEGQEGMPTAWSSYVTVESADAAAAKAADLGGTPMADPFDVMDAGRMAVIQDPTGAVVSVWEPHGSTGAQFVNGPGALSLNQLNTTDPEAAQRFYGGLFGWRTEEVSGGDQAYWGIYNGETLNGGMMQLPPDAPAPPHWLVYFGSEDVDADAGRIGDAGGNVLVPPTDVPGGRFLAAQDPQGAVFGLFAGRFDD